MHIFPPPPRFVSLSHSPSFCSSFIFFIYPTKAFIYVKFGVWRSNVNDDHRYGVAVDLYDLVNIDNGFNHNIF